jgi:isopentenyl-diphosphate delta-isomerase
LSYPKREIHDQNFNGFALPPHNLNEYEVMENEEYVTLVDENDQIVGTMEKMEAHVKGVLHRAFSIFIFNTKGQLLLQQRAIQKYHSGGKWTNTCCSHPRLGEDIIIAAKRRLAEEMGLQCPLQHMFNFIYHAKVGQGMTEHEFDHVFWGVTDTLPLLNQDEVIAYKYEYLTDLEQDIKIYPEQYTQWFKICFDQIKSCYVQKAC